MRKADAAPGRRPGNPRPGRCLFSASPRSVSPATAHGALCRRP